uniref:Uncharacterized protein n=1 Tax=Cyprinodon variegatus TaxID=28743 RepID=A0A3Q2CJL1_CYPVA
MTFKKQLPCLYLSINIIFIYRHKAAIITKYALRQTEAETLNLYNFALSLAFFNLHCLCTFTLPFLEKGQSF